MKRRTGAIIAACGVVLPFLLPHSRASLAQETAGHEKRYFSVAMTDSAVYFVDETSVASMSDETTASLLLVFEPPRVSGPYRIAYAVRKDTFSCDSRTDEITYETNYAADGAELNSGSPNPKVLSVKPNTVIDQVLNHVCSHDQSWRDHLATAEDAICIARETLRDPAKDAKDLAATCQHRPTI
jgi:hypothetical protein